MHVHTQVTGYYDWMPAPAGTEITQADIKANRVKPMADDAWHIRVEREADTFNDASIPEGAICDRMASLELLGRSQSREATVHELVAQVYRHHLDARKHIVKITVHDDGPNAELYAADLARLGVTGAQAEQALEAYMTEGDIEAYLNAVFKSRPTKKPAPKETP